MSAVLLSQLKSGGFTLSRQGDQLVVVPRELLTDDLRNCIRNNKSALLSVLAEADNAHSETDGRGIPDLDRRIRSLAERWQYSADELAEALAGAKSDPLGWLLWTEREERNFGHCRTPEEFAE